jgi:microcompartment protein CcmK/EutM
MRSCRSVAPARPVAAAGNNGDDQPTRLAMILGKIIGTLVASRKEPTLEGLKLLVVRACDVDGNPTGAIAIAVDAVGAGIGEVVLYAAGSSARQTQATQNRPVDATIMAIVDEITIGGERRYVKD